MGSLAALRSAHAAISLPQSHAVVVGGTSGIGKGIALRLAAANVHVLIVGRNALRGEEVVAAMRARSTLPGVSHEFMPCDAQLLSNVKTLCDVIKGRWTSLDFLVLTQGIATLQGRTETAEGIDQKLALHYYSRMAFILQLLPLLRNSRGPFAGAATTARVLSVLSAGVHSPYAQYASDPELKEHYSLKNAADAAGFFTDCAMDSLSREPGNEHLAFVHAAPGFVASSWGTEMPWAVRMLLSAVRPLGTSIEDCGEFMCDPLFRADLSPGLHLVGARAQPASLTKLHEAARPVVWQNTRALLRRVPGSGLLSD